MSRKTADTYTASVARLRTLVAKLESAQVDVDELEAVVRESVELVTACRSRLRATQNSVDTLLAGLQDDAAAPQQPISVPAPPAASTATTQPPLRIVPAHAASATSDDFDPFAED